MAGSGTDQDGTVVNYNWTKLSGPSSYNIVNASSPVTDVSGLVQGVYKFELKVTDNNGAIGLDTVQITVNAAANIPPTANAGLDQSITLPTNTVSLNGNGTDADGNISSYNWIKISGPVSGTITNANSASTSVTGLAQGVYQFKLKVTDNNAATALDSVQITVNATTANIAPTANAGPDQTITTSTVNLSGSGTDADGTITTYAWKWVSGPNTPTIVSSNSSSTSVTGLQAGTHVFSLTVTDNNGATNTDMLSVVVLAGNATPTANAGPDQTITLPLSTVSLSGTGTDADGTISAYNWTEISGLASSTITNANSASTSVTGLVQGVHRFKLKVTDNNGATALDSVQITVNATTANISPTANAGADQTITTSTVNFSGSGTDADGTITTYAWRWESGPNTPTIVSSNSSSTSVTGLQAGTHVFSLTVTDNNGATNTDMLSVVVLAGNATPIANAGPDQRITLPLRTVSLSGTGTDANGTISAYNWTKISGPSAGTITNTSSAATSVTGLLQGVYQFQLKVTDNNGATDLDTLQITVNKLKRNRNFVYQNAPNPFTGITTIRYEVADKAPVKIIVYNAKSIPVAVLANEIKQPGSYQIQWNAENIPSGTYFYTVIIGDNVTTKKMLKIN